MGHTNSTANLGLPQFIGTDKPTWLSDVNGAFAAIDTYAGNNDAALAITDAKADTAVNDAASAVTTATNAANTAGTASTQATNAVTVAGNALTVANGINSKVGVLTDLTTTDKSTIVNAINEVNGKDAGDIAYDNTGSGLTATNVQDAIDEVAQGGGGGGSSDVVFDEVWANADVTQTFAAQDVTPSDLKGHVAFVIQYVGNNSNLNDQLFSHTVNQSTYKHVVPAVANYFRTVIFDGTKFTFGDGAISGGSTNNALLIPYKIYGI